ncbi:MAG: hypothetical protein U1A78_32800 [Polyangia bacterium]
MPPSPLPSRLLHHGFALALALLSFGALGSDVSPCGGSRRRLHTQPPPPPATATVTAPATTAASEPSAEQLRACCQQCAAAATRDPAGIDLRVQPCSRYRGARPDGSPGLDEPCAALLSERKLTIGACQQQAAPQ